MSTKKDNRATVVAAEKNAKSRVRAAWIAGISAVVVALIGGIFLFFSPDSPKQIVAKPKTANESVFSSIFPPSDTTSFNVLILRFEEYTPQNSTMANCIGLSFEDKLRVISENEKLPLKLNPVYVDSISRPKSSSIAAEIRERHHADLVLYGPLRNLGEACDEVEVCLRYDLSRKVHSVAKQETEVKVMKYDTDWQLIHPLETENSLFHVDKIAVEKWIIGLVYSKAGSYQEMAALYEKVVNDESVSSKKRAKRAFIFADTYQKIGATELALSYFIKTLKLDSTLSEAFIARGYLKTDLEYYEGALADFTDAIRINSNNAEAYLARGKSEIKLGVKNMEKEHLKNAISDFNIAIKLLLISTNTLKDTLILAQSYNSRGYSKDLLTKKYQEGILDFDTAIMWHPDFVAPYKNKAYAYIEMNMFKKAIENCNIVLKYEPNEPLNFLFRALSYFGNQQFKEAISDFNTAEKIYPLEPTNLVLRGRSHIAIGNFDRGFKDIDNAISILSSSSKSEDIKFREEVKSLKKEYWEKVYN